MLLTRKALDEIVAGEIDIVFRRWKRPTVKTGGSLRTAVGMLSIRSVDKISLSSISVPDAQRAGYRTKSALLDELSQRSGDVYRIELTYAGADPRIELRENTDLSPEDLDMLRDRLDAMDRRSDRGPWTRSTLELLAQHPGVRAQDLADRVGIEKHRFKTDVRKLKGLGLTISHSPGYELSPRGRALLGSIDEKRS